MPRFYRFLTAALLLSFGFWVQAADAPVIRGFDPARGAAELALEEKFQRVPSGEQAERHLSVLTSEPHMAGTQADYETARYVRDRFAAYGLAAEVVEYHVLLPYPKEVVAELVAPERRPGPMPEEPWQWDKDTFSSQAVKAYSAYSPSGEATAPVVYANFGLPEDYQRLEEMGVDVEGKIVIVRYGRSFRGVKAKVAEEHKAAGVLIYSDPKDDGYGAGDPYPRGPWRPDSGVQRGSILYIFQYPGDPQTPEGPSVSGGRRTDAKNAPNLPRILCVPLSARDAAPILSNLGGPVVPREWQGGLPFAYHIGPGQSQVHIKLQMDYQVRTIWNVIGRIRGTAEPEEIVLVGNHRDAWVFGAVDPSSGTTVMLETARGLGELLRQGWKPRRSIWLASWDGEEFGLLGSSEWGEQMARELSEKAVAYVNVDAGVSGSTFGSSAVPSLKAVVREATRAVNEPREGRSVYDVWRDKFERGIVRRPSTPEAEPTPQTLTRGQEVPLGTLGSGSDYTVFQHHLGIPSIDMGFGGDYGVYHAIYDDFYWMKHFGDPTFAYHATLARVLGVLTLRLAESDVLPFDYEEYGSDVQVYLGELAARLQRHGGEGKVTLEAAERAAREFTEAATELKRAFADTKIDNAAALNRELVSVERSLLNPTGLPRRPWYKHTIFAPGTYTGYAAVVFPGVREAVDRKDWTEAQAQVQVLAQALERARDRLRAARALVH